WSVITGEQCLHARLGECFREVCCKNGFSRARAAMYQYTLESADRFQQMELLLRQKRDLPVFGANQWANAEGELKRFGEQHPKGLKTIDPKVGPMLLLMLLFEPLRYPFAETSLIRI